MPLPDLSLTRSHLTKKSSQLPASISIPKSLKEELKKSWEKCEDVTETGVMLKSKSSGTPILRPVSDLDICKAIAGRTLTRELLQYKELFIKKSDEAKIPRNELKLLTAKASYMSPPHWWSTFQQTIQTGLNSVDSQFLSDFILNKEWSGCTKGIERGDFYISSVVNAAGGNVTHNSSIGEVSKELLGNDVANKIEACISAEDYDFTSVTSKDSSSLFKALNTNNSTDASLLSKPFLILTGLSGSGKTRSALLVAQTLGNTRYEIIPVGADWNNRDALLGYPDGLSSNRYISTSALSLILAASTNTALPHFLILDEMNLSHVERYFADFLSAMESGEEIPLYEGETRYAELSSTGIGVEGSEIPKLLKLPNNLFVIGTVNVDETTYQFSPKVLDRANVIEFSMEPKNVAAFFAHSNDDAVEYCGDAEAKQFVIDANTEDEIAIDFAKSHPRFTKEMQTLFELLQEFNAEFGYRTLKEASRYLYFSISDSPDDEQAYLDTMDAIIIQKLLPKLHGSRPKLERQLRALHYYCSKVNTSGDLDLLKADSLKVAQDTSSLGELSADGTYVRSTKKLAKICNKLERDQFVSFAEA